MSRYSSASCVPFYRLFWLSLKLKTLMSYGLLAIVTVNNSPAPAQAQALNQIPSTSPSYVAPKGGFTTLDTPSCSNSISFSEYSSGTAINSQYSNKGIVFGGSNPFITTDGANPTSPVLSGSPQFIGAIEGTFVNPIDGITPVVVESFQLEAGYLDSVGSTALKLYDKKGNLIEQRTNTGLGIFKFTVEGLPVAKWRIEPVGDEPAGFAVDNVCFTLRALESPRLYPKALLNGGTLESIPDTVPPTPPEIFQSQDNDEDYVDDEKTSNEDYLEEEANSQFNTNSTLTPLSNNVATLDPKRLDPKKVAQLSCEGIGTPLDKPKLDQIVREAFPNASDEFIQDTFEATALASQDLEKYDERTFGRFPSPERAIRSKNTRRNVVPDAVSDPVIIDQAPFQYGPPIPIRYPLSAFWDAKVLQVDKGIRLSESRYQAQGFLDYLSHYSSAALAPVPKNKHPRGHLVYITTASTRGVSKGIQNYKGSTPGVPFTPVLVYHAVACIRNITETTTDFIQIGRGILLNGDRSEFIG